MNIQTMGIVVMTSCSMNIQKMRTVVTTSCSVQGH